MASTVALAPYPSFVVDLEWREGKVTALEIRSMKGAPLVLSNEERIVEVPTEAGQVLVFDAQLER